MKKSKVLLVLFILVLAFVCAPLTNVFAYTTGGTQTGSTNIITLPWHPGTPNLYWKFFFKETGETVYCIEPHVVYNSNHEYGYIGKYSQATGRDAMYGRAMAYVISTGELDDLGEENCRQVKQTVIWGLNGDYDIYSLDRGNGYVNRAIACYENAINAANGPDIWNLMNNHNLSFHLEGNNWVSNWIYIKGGSSVWNDYGGLQRDGDNWRLVVANSGLTGTITAHIYCSKSGNAYEEADAYDGPNNTSSDGQTVVVGGSSSTQSNSEEAAGNITPVGTLVVQKKDNYGNNRAGAVFHITGPGGTWDVTTGNDGKATLTNIVIGSYNITETQAPNNMKNEESNRSVNVSVTAGNTTTFARTNAFQRGFATLTKYDSRNRNHILGDAKLQGAVYALYAAEQIKEGDTVVYQKDQAVKINIVTKADGTIDPVTDLPIGNYYFVETAPSEGYNLNTTRYPVTVSYNGQYANTASTGATECPEDEIQANVEVHKRLGETDYDAEINLAEAQFKLTLVNDSEQVYYSTESGDDGMCYFENIPYGKYTLSESKTPDSAYTVADREVSIVEQGKTVSQTIVDEPKVMCVEINKSMVVNEGEATDAVVEGAVFSVYKDEAATQPYVDKNGNDVKLGPTDANGHVISQQMRTGKYYLKETTFPVGTDADATVEGENVTYKEKVYDASVDNATQGHEAVTKTLGINNVPKRNSVRINKTIGETSNTEQFPIDQCEFTATLKSSIGTDHEFSRKCTAETTRDDGYCIIEELPYGEYVFEETKVSPIALKCDKFTIFIKEDKKSRQAYEPKDATFETTILDQNPQTEWLDDHGNIVDIPKVMQIKVRKIDANWAEGDPVDYMQGDATLEGAKYGIYRYDPETDDYTEDVYTITVDHRDDDGYWCAESRELLVGKYMVKELIARSEDGYDYSYAEGYLVDPVEHYFEVKPDTQTERISYHTDISEEEVARGFVYIRKEDEDRSNVDSENDSDKNPAAGAVMRLTLDSNPEIYYEVILDENGYGEFVETNDEVHKSTAKHDSNGYYPNTIPFGKYTITEREEGTATKRTNFYTQPEPVTIEKQDELQFRIEMDNPVPVWLKIIKKDADNETVVKIPDGKYKIYEVETGRFVEMVTYPGDVLSEFKSTPEGYLFLPEKINPGEYVVYETEAPKGYYLEDDWRLPEDESDYGKVGGKKIKIDKIVAGLAEDAVNPGQVQVGQYQYDVEIPDTHLRVNLVVEKKGEKLVDTTNESVSYLDQNDEEIELTKNVPIYQYVGLANVTYELYANEEIVDANGVPQARNGELVDTFVTDSEGIGKSRLDLYPGEYRLHEAEVPEGYTVGEDRIVLLENENQLIKSNTTRIVLNDERQKFAFDFNKVFEESQFVTENEEKRAVFGVYVKENIKNNAGNVALYADDLVDLLEIENDGTVELEADLPEGKYYVKELFATYPYGINSDQIEFELKHVGNTDLVEVHGDEFVNTCETCALFFIKMSPSSDDQPVMRGKNLRTSKNYAQKVDNTLNMFKEIRIDNLDEMEETIKSYYKENKIIVVPQASYEIWLDKTGTKKLSQKDELGKITPAKFKTSRLGTLSVPEVPKGEYYLKETDAPEGYEAPEEPIKFVISDGDVDSTMFQAIQETVTASKLLHKTDIYTGENVADCTFEITDEEGNVLLHAITDEDGLAWIPQDIFENGKTYYYTEIDAPDVYKDDGQLYVLNTKPHKFVAKFDENGKWATEKFEVENLRPVTDVKFIKTDDKGNLVPDCKFELKSEEDGLYYETGVTDKNGIYVFEDVPQGWYTYTELEAPEEYNLDTTPHRVYVTGDEMIVDFVNTGDIQVIALSVLALVSMVGISYLIIRKVKSAKIA